MKFGISSPEDEQMNTLAPSEEEQFPIEQKS
jgi:hypothetical protein